MARSTPDLHAVEHERGELMKRKGPILTLMAGVILAAVVLVFNINGYAAKQRAASNNRTEPAATTPAPAETTTPPAPPAVEPPVTYAGNVGGGGASIAIAVKDGKAIAYLCDGASAEAWLQGTGTDGQLKLTGADGASLNATYANGTATGTVAAVGRQWTFAVASVAPPSGLYRANATVANAQIVGGWIVLADGTQVGTTRKGGVIAKAPTLNTANQSAVLDGETVAVDIVDGTRLN
jgi:serine/threonine-protein kinase